MFGSRLKPFPGFTARYRERMWLLTMGTRGRHNLRSTLFSPLHVYEGKPLGW